MSETKVCACTSKRTCDTCAERDFALLLARCKADPKYQKEEEEGRHIVIAPDPAARESRTGFHRCGERGRKVERERDDVENVPTSDDLERISARVRAAKPASYGKSDVSWYCPRCKWLGKDAEPLAGKDGVHCPNDGCDERVSIAPLTPEPEPEKRNPGPWMGAYLDGRV